MKCMQRVGVGLGFLAGLLCIASASPPALASTVGTAEVSASAIPSLAGEPLSESDCYTVCDKCQDGCGDRPAGSARDNCKMACTSTAAGCCARYGKKAPGYLGCSCN